MISRRDFLGWCSSTIAAIALWPRLSIASVSAGNDHPKKFRWRVPEVYYNTVKNELQFDGEIKEAEKDTKGIPLVYLFVGVVLLPYLAKAVLALRRDIVFGGVIIDTRGEEIEVNTDKGLSGGVIIVVTPTDTELYERDEIESPEKLVDILLKAK